MIVFSNDGSEFGGSLYHKHSKDMETSVSLGWRADSNKVSFGVGCKYILDGNSSVRGKIDNDAHLGLSLQHKLRDGKYRHCIMFRNLVNL